MANRKAKGDRAELQTIIRDLPQVRALINAYYDLSLQEDRDYLVSLPSSVAKTLLDVFDMQAAS